MGTMMLMGAGTGAPGGGGGPPTPLQILQSFNPIRLFDHKLGVVGYTNTPPLDNENLLSIQDYSANAAHGDSSLSGGKPVYKISGDTNINTGIDCGAQTGVLLMATPLALSGAFTIYGICHRVAGTSGHCPFFGDTTGGQSEIAIMFVSTANRFRIFFDEGASNTNAITAAGILMFRVICGNDGNAANNNYAGTGQAPVGFVTPPNGRTIANLDVLAIGASTLPGAATRFRHVGIYPGIITAGSATDIAIKQAMNDIQGTALTIAT